MRSLRFIINGHRIEKDPECDFSGVIAGTQNYLKAQFVFSDDWDDCIKIASFWRGNEEHAIIIKDGECLIPADVLISRIFSVSIVGKRGTYKILTNRVRVTQEVIR